MYIGSFRGQFVSCDNQIKQFTTIDRNKNSEDVFKRS